MTGVQPSCAILIPAAGASLRMRGTDKLLEPVQAEAILRRVCRLALQSGAQVAVTLPDRGPLAEARRGALAGLAATLLSVENAKEGMAASLRAGARHFTEAAGMMVLLPDMPDIDAADIDAVMAAFACDTDQPIRAASVSLAPGHPVIFPRRLIPKLADLRGDRGALSVLAGETVRLLPLAGNRALTDLDTPGDWARWRAMAAATP